MKKPLLALLLLTSFLVIALEANRQKEIHDYPNNGLTEKQENNLKYFRELNRFFLASDDLKFQLSSLYSNSKIKTNQDTVKNILEQAINSTSDAYTLFLAERICHNFKELTSWCHQQNIHEVHYKVDPENFYTYLFDLHEEDSEFVIQSTIVQAAERSSHANSFFFEHIIEVAQQLEIFNRENPKLFAHYIGLYDSDNMTYKQELDNKVISLQLVEKGIASSDYQKHISVNTSITQAIGMEMARGMSYKSLMDFCRNAIDAKPCLVIGELLKKEGTLMVQMIGISLTNYAQNTMVIGSDVILDNDKRKESYEEYTCYAQLQEVNYALMMNKELTNQYILDAKELGEVQAMKKLVFNVFTIEEEHGFKPDFDLHECQ